MFRIWRNPYTRLAPARAVARLGLLLAPARPRSKMNRATWVADQRPGSRIWSRSTRSSILLSHGAGAARARSTCGRPLLRQHLTSIHHHRGGV
jgi:hypothetical protein